MVSLTLLLVGLLAAMVYANQHTEAIIDWVRAKGGYFSDKLEIRRMDPSDATSPLGVFAKNDIDPKERLLEVPHECYISLWDEANEIDDTEEAHWHYDNLCKMAHKLMKEMKLGKDSEFAPYIAYLETQTPGQLPAMWSKAGKDLLRKVYTEGSDAVDWIDRHFKQTGCIRADDPFEEHIVELLIQRGYDTTLIPIWDMVNHDNGLINTENDSMYDNGGIRVRASEKILAGEEIYATYDECVDCTDLASYWGTPEILRDFGFVERYPRRFVFYNQRIWFELDENEDDQVEVVWDLVGDNDEKDQEVYGYPDEEAVRFMKDELERLEKLGHSELKKQGAVPTHEWNIILQFHEASMAALSKAIDAVPAVQ